MSKKIIPKFNYSYFIISISLFLVGVVTFYKWKELDLSRINDKTLMSLFELKTIGSNIERRIEKIKDLKKLYVLSSSDKSRMEYLKEKELLSLDLINLNRYASRDGYIKENAIEIQRLVEELYSSNQEIIDLMTSGERVKAFQGLEQNLDVKLNRDIKEQLSLIRDYEAKFVITNIVDINKDQNRSSEVQFHLTLIVFILLFSLAIVMYQEFRRQKLIQQHYAIGYKEQNSMLKSTAMPLITFDTKGKVTLFNSAAENLLGYKESEVLGKDVTIFFLNDELIKRAEKLSNSLGAKIPPDHQVLWVKTRWNIIEEEDWKFVSKDGKTTQVKLTVSPLRDERYLTYGYVGVAYNATKQVEFEKNIINEKEEAQAEMKSKTEFLANMSHEIRTPMNAILGMAELLSETNLDQEQKKYVQVFHRAGESLLELINDILDISKIEAAQFSLVEAPFNLRQLVDKTSELVSARVRQKGLKFVVNIDPDVPQNFVGDEHRIRQVILNLLGNAIKFTKKGGIHLKVSSKVISNEKYEVIIKVQDTGIGMSKEHMGKIFKRFSQADSTITKEFGGTGLGLSISKKLVELMGGEISVQSQFGVGSVFTVTMKLNTSTEEVPVEVEKVDTPVEFFNLSILLVDDNDENRLVIKSFLKKLPWEIHEVKNGAEALTQFQTKSYDIILMDMQMPVMDGYTAAKEIRKLEIRDELLPTPIIALTAYALKEEFQMSIEAGCNGHLTKPVKKNDLIDEILNSVGTAKVVIMKDLEDIIPGYLLNRHQEVKDISAAIKIGDFDKLKSIGHKLKGTAGSYGFSELSVVGAEIEENSKLKDMESIKTALVFYQRYLKRVKVFYQ